MPRLLRLVALLAVLALLAACGGGDDDDKATTAAQNAPGRGAYHAPQTSAVPATTAMPAGTWWISPRSLGTPTNSATSSTAVGAWMCASGSSGPVVISAG